MVKVRVCVAGAVKVSRDNVPSPVKKLGFTYKTPGSRRMTFGGMQRDDEGDVVDESGPEACPSSVTPADSLPIDYIVITELSELFDHAVSISHSVIVSCNLSRVGKS